MTLSIMFGLIFQAVSFLFKHCVVILNDIRSYPLQSKISTPVQDLPPPPPMTEGDDDDYYENGSQQVRILWHGSNQGASLAPPYPLNNQNVANANVNH